MNGELVPLGEEREERAIGGEFLGKAGVGTPEDAHAPEESIVPLHDPRWKAEQLTPDWVIERLMREATDHGKRTRQSSRVAALKTLAEVQGMMDKRDPGEEKSMVQRAMEELPPEERRALIRKKLSQMPEFKDLFS